MNQEEENFRNDNSKTRKISQPILTNSDGGGGRNQIAIKSQDGGEIKVVSRQYVDIECIFGNGIDNPPHKTFSDYGVVNFFKSRERQDFAKMFASIMFVGKKNFNIKEYIFSDVLTMVIRKGEYMTKCIVKMRDLLSQSRLEFEIFLDITLNKENPLALSKEVVQNIFPGLYSFVISREQLAEIRAAKITKTVIEENQDNRTPSQIKSQKDKLVKLVRKKIDVITNQLTDQTFLIGFIVDSKYINFLKFGQYTTSQFTKKQQKKRCFKCGKSMKRPLYCSCEYAYYCGENCRVDDWEKRHRSVCDFDEE